MALQIVTGYAGRAHITAADDGAMQAGIVGMGKYVLNVGNKFAHTVVSNNSITIKDGSLIDQGRHIDLPYGETLTATITNGTQSKYRKDIIGIQYTKNTTTGIETVSLVVKKGTEAASESAAKDPAYATGNILQGATSDFFPLYRVTLNGLSISSVTALFNVMVSMDELNMKLSDQIHWKPSGHCSLGEAVSLANLDLTKINEFRIIFTFKATHNMETTYARSDIHITDVGSYGLYLTGYFYSNAYSASLAALYDPSNKRIVFDKSWTKVTVGSSEVENVNDKTMWVQYR